MDIINGLLLLCKEFGTSDFVKGGGGNASCKNQDHLFIKGSGLTLLSTTAQNLIKIDRKKIRPLFTTEAPLDVTAREKFVSDFLLSSVVSDSPQGRPSVETPLHELFDATYVIHTHPPLVNGMTCGVNGKAKCKELFPDSLWVDYTDPGYTLSMQVAKEMDSYKATYNKQPSLIFLQNHGVFVAGFTPDEVRGYYKLIIDILKNHYSKAGVSVDLNQSCHDCVIDVDGYSALREVHGKSTVIASAKPVAIPPGPLTPDHVVYHGSYPLIGEPTKEAIENHKNKYGTFPRYCLTDSVLIGAGRNESNAKLILEMAYDGALVYQLTKAFGGQRFLNERERLFIENWEAEHYRLKTLTDLADTKSSKSQGCLDFQIAKSKMYSTYEYARELYSQFGINTDEVLEKLKSIPVSLQCWQGDDVGGFENSSSLTGGILATGNYPGKARTPEELRQDLTFAFSCIPGTNRANIHAMYGEFAGKKVDRNEIEISHYEGWVTWAKENKIGLDFNGTFFSHPKSSNGFTLSHRDASIQNFWIEHGKRSRYIGQEFGKRLGSPSVVNLWIPDGYKDIPVDRLTPRKILLDSLEKIYHEKLDTHLVKDAVESKLFGLGSESYVVGSHEFYLAFAVKNKIMPCFDMGHFHPTESIADKISSVLLFCDDLLLHISRPVRWDSDHVVTLNDDTIAVCAEAVRSGKIKNIHFALDYFDASVNRIAAWVVGARALRKALLISLLEPTDKIRGGEMNHDLTQRLVFLEDTKSLPWNVVWNHFCVTNDVPSDFDWYTLVKDYENRVLSKR